MNFIRAFCFLLCFSGMILLGSSGVQSQSSPLKPEASVTAALVGDAIQTQRIMPLYTAGDQGFIFVVDLIGAADAAIVNLEESLFEMSGFNGWPEVGSGGQWELGPCALVTVKSIWGLSKTVNQTFAAKISQRLQKELGISPNRVHGTFGDLASTHWAWNGKTLG
jgi:hypothetical protein